MRIRVLGWAVGLACGVSLAALSPASAQVPASIAGETAEADAFAAEPALFMTRAEDVDRYCDRGPERVAAQRAALEAETGPATIDGTFRRYDNLVLTAFSLSNDAGLVGNVHVDKPVRDAALAQDFLGRPLGLDAYRARLGAAD